MKRQAVPTLEIILTTDMIAGVAAATKVKHPISVSKEYLITDEQLQIINDIVDSTVTNVLSHNFKILSEYQSKKSYSYYIKFRPKSDSGEILQDFKIIFRLSNHNLKDRRSGKNTRNTFIKSLIINDEVFTDPIRFIYKINDICDEIAQGDYSSLI